MDAKLVVVGGDTNYKEIELRASSVVGRSKECDIVLRHALVSRRHCQISIVGPILRVRDLDSLNGTFVGQDRITESDLLPGELLTIGTVTFRAVYRDWTESGSFSNLPMAAKAPSEDADLATDEDETKNAQDATALVSPVKNQAVV